MCEDPEFRGEARLHHCFLAVANLLAIHVEDENVVGIGHAFAVGACSVLRSRCETNGGIVNSGEAFGVDATSSSAYVQSLGHI